MGWGWGREWAAWVGVEGLCVLAAPPPSPPSSLWRCRRGGVGGGEFVSNRPIYRTHISLMRARGPVQQAAGGAGGAATGHSNAGEAPAAMPCMCWRIGRPRGTAKQTTRQTMLSQGRVATDCQPTQATHLWRHRCCRPPSRCFPSLKDANSMGGGHSAACTAAGHHHTAPQDRVKAKCNTGASRTTGIRQRDCAAMNVDRRGWEQ